MYKRFFKMQRKFDNRVIRQLGIQKPTITDKAMAILTEIGEFANEEGSLKYWKKRKQQDLQKALFEYIDMLKFSISIAQDLGITHKDVEATKLIYYPSINDQLVALSYCVTMISKYPATETKRLHALTALALLKGVQAHCSFTDTKVWDAWNLKHEENVKRLKAQVAA